MLLCAGNTAIPLQHYLRLEPLIIDYCLSLHPTPSPLGLFIWQVIEVKEESVSPKELRTSSE